MKGLQGERLRQAFRYLDTDQDGFIRPDEFKQIILVCLMSCTFSVKFIPALRKSRVTNYRTRS